MTRGEAWRLGHRPQLDGLRGVAVLLVLLGHTGIGTVHTAGRVGVTMFFALSGFLITSLLLDERARVGSVSLRAFYIRRACRLLPALFVFLASMALMSLFSSKKTAPSTTDFLGALFYVGNYTTAMQGRDNVIGHTWSLAIEEQFYIVWPIVLILVLAKSGGRFRPLVWVAIGASVGSLLLRAVLWDGGAGHTRIYYGTDTRLDSLLVGCLAAMWIRQRRPGRNQPLVVAAALGGVGVLCFSTGAYEFLVVPAVVPVLTCLAIVCLVRAPHTGPLASRPLCLVGQRSYGIYLWHFPLFGAAVNLALPIRWPALVIAAALTAAVVHLSWRCVEEPFLRLKGRVAPSDRGSKSAASALSRPAVPASPPVSSPWDRQALDT